MFEFSLPLAVLVSDAMNVPSCTPNAERTDMSLYLHEYYAQYLRHIVASAPRVVQPAALDANKHTHTQTHSSEHASLMRAYLTRTRGCRATSTTKMIVIPKVPAQQRSRVVVPVCMCVIVRECFSSAVDGRIGCGRCRGFNDDRRRQNV